MKQSYVVTEKAGPRVAGQRVVIGQRLELTEAEALYHRDLGEIVVAPAEQAPVPEPDLPTGKAKR